MSDAVTTTRSLQVQRADPQRAGVRPAPRMAPPARPGIDHLQRKLGNAGMHRLLRAGGIQPKLTVGPADDEYEREADRVADEVMRMPDPGATTPVQRSTLRVQRSCSKCEEEDGEIQRKIDFSDQKDDEKDKDEDAIAQAKSNAGGDRPEPSSDLASFVASSRGGGQPLPGPTRSFFEPRFGHDLGSVRVHTNYRSANAAAEIKSYAFATGSDIHFGAGRFQPGIPEGDRLLAHELTHTIQQTGGHPLAATGTAPAPISNESAPAGVISRSPDNQLQRQPTSTTAVTPTAATYRESVREAIRFFETGASFFGRPSVPIDLATFDRVVNGWYGMVVRQESLIDTQLGRDAALTRDLHAAYIAAIRVVMTKAATKLGRTEDDLYRENSGRIPLWAWQTAHHIEPGISTPIAQGRTVNRAGNVVFASKGFNVTIKPDLTGQTLRTGAVTSASVSWSGVSFSHGTTGRQLVTRFDPLTTPAVEIQTKFRTGAGQADRSAYGRGTTKEDVAGGKVTPRSTTLGFHEGAHGVDIVKFLESNPPPAFRGTVGMTRVAFEAEITRFDKACDDYGKAMAAFSARHGDCVGTTIDQFRRAQAPRGTRIVLECGP